MKALVTREIIWMRAPRYIPRTRTGVLIVVDREKAKRLFLKTIRMCGGQSCMVYRKLGISRRAYYWQLNMLGITHVPKEVRDKLKNRFRLAPVETL